MKPPRLTAMKECSSAVEPLSCTVTCLDCMMKDKGDLKEEEPNRTADCRAIMVCMDAYWKHMSNCSTFKIRMWEAVVRSYLRCGLEPLQRDKSLKRKLGVFR